MTRTKKQSTESTQIKTTGSIGFPRVEMQPIPDGERRGVVIAGVRRDRAGPVAESESEGFASQERDPKMGSRDAESESEGFAS
jgi:hypothetical protein